MAVPPSSGAAVVTTRLHAYSCPAVSLTSPFQMFVSPPHPQDTSTVPDTCIHVCAHQTAPRVNAYLSITMISSYTQGGELFKNARLGATTEHDPRARWAQVVNLGAS